MSSFEVIVVGSGPNGLSAAITMARAGHSVLVLEATSTVGGGTRSEEATLPGFLHDICSAVHPLAVVSPFFESLELEKWGVEWIDSPSVLAHPLGGEKCVLLEKSLDVTAHGLGEDGNAYFNLMKPFVENWRNLLPEILKPLWHLPERPFLLAQFGWKALLPATTYAKSFFRTPEAQALFAGIAAHANAPLENMATSSVGLMLNLAAHARGWPIPQGGSQKIADALAAILRSMGGEIQLQSPVRSIKDLPPAKWVFMDLTPRQILSILDGKLNSHQRKQLFQYQYGPGVFKMDWALSEPIPWSASKCFQAATLHLGGSLEEIAASEKGGSLSEKPYVLLSQPSLFDSSRAPKGKHTAWAYCHVPNGSLQDQTQPIERQIERFAPGFRDVILARRTLNPAELERKNANLIGGDISGGAVNFKQLLFRPSLGLSPYRLPLPGFYICSSSTPPGPGVHGMCGFNAAERALRDSQKMTSSKVASILV